MNLLAFLYDALKFIQLPDFLKRVTFGNPSSNPIARTSFQSLPNELLLEIFSFLELKPYIICRGVCQAWRELLPLTEMDPVRSRLLDLYYRILDTPDFEKALEWTSKNLQPFDGEEYISCLLRQYPAIPDEFRMWILEWPAQLVIQCTWPGLTFTNCRMITPTCRRTGVNWIAYRPFSPQLSSLVYKRKLPNQTVIPGLFIWCDATETDWLIFEHDEPNLFGRVYRIEAYYHIPGSIPYYPHRKRNHDRVDGKTNVDDDNDEDSDTESMFSEGEDGLLVFSDWISYLDSLWSENVDEILDQHKVYFCPDPPVMQPVPCNFGGVGDDVLPAPAWDLAGTTVLRIKMFSPS